MQFLNRLLCSTNLKSANSLHPRGESRKKSFARGKSQRNFLQEGNAKHTHLAGVTTINPFENYLILFFHK
jgi:hypothetical protein